MFNHLFALIGFQNYVSIVLSKMVVLRISHGLIFHYRAEVVATSDLLLRSAHLAFRRTIGKVTYTSHLSLLVEATSSCNSSSASFSVGLACSLQGLRNENPITLDRFFQILNMDMLVVGMGD